MTDTPAAPATCWHPSIHVSRNEEHDITVWACEDCRRRFYPACEQCVSIGHREGHGEHIEARATPGEPLDVPTFAVEVRDELTRARSKFSPITSLHEGYAVILEELDEFWEDVRNDDPEQLIRAYRELVQVAAMAQRTAEDVIARLRASESDR